LPFRVIQGNQFGTNRKLIYDFLSVFNSNLPAILHRLRDIAFEMSKSLYLVTLLRLNLPTEGFPWDDLRKIFGECQKMANVRNSCFILVENVYTLLMNMLIWIILFRIAWEINTIFCTEEICCVARLIMYCVSSASNILQ